MRYLKINITLLVLFLFQTTAFAQADTLQQNKSIDFKDFFWHNLPKPTGWVNDYEGLYSKENENVLDSIIKVFKNSTTIEIAIVTIDSSMTSKENFDSLTLHITKTWGVGVKGKNNGILIGISKGHRKMRIQNGYGIEKMISDKETKEVIDKYFVPSFKNGEYYEGTLLGLSKLIELLNSKKEDH